VDRQLTELVLAAGNATATIAPSLGGRLAQLDLGDGPLLRPAGPELGWAEWGSYPLLPWSNRLPDGRLRWRDIDAQLPVNWPDGSALHGLADDVPWDLAGADDRSAELTVVVAQDPYRIRGAQRLLLGETELALELSVENLGGATVPIGLGIHPWFRAGALTVPADAYWPGEPLPSGPPASVSGSYDLRRATTPPVEDCCFTRLTASELRAPGVALSWEGPITQVVVYTGEAGWACVEPVTMANDGFNLARRSIDGHGVFELESGETARVLYRFRRAD
jgi:aldose 1-epimerase